MNTSFKTKTWIKIQDCDFIKKSETKTWKLESSRVRLRIQQCQFCQNFSKIFPRTCHHYFKTEFLSNFWHFSCMWLFFIACRCSRKQIVELTILLEYRIQSLKLIGLRARAAKSTNTDQVFILQQLWEILVVWQRHLHMFCWLQKIILPSSSWKGSGSIVGIQCWWPPATGHQVSQQSQITTIHHGCWTPIRLCAVTPLCSPYELDKQ